MTEIYKFCNFNPPPPNLIVEIRQNLEKNPFKTNIEFKGRGRQVEEEIYEFFVFVLFILCRIVDVFLELDHQFFLNFGMVLKTHVKLCATTPIFFKKKFTCPKSGKKIKAKIQFNDFRVRIVNRTMAV